MCEPHAFGVAICLKSRLLTPPPQRSRLCIEKIQDRHHNVDEFEVIYTLECNHSVYLNCPKIIFSLKTNIGHARYQKFNLRTKWDGWMVSFGGSFLEFQLRGWSLFSHTALHGAHFLCNCCDKDGR